MNIKLFRPLLVMLLFTTAIFAQTITTTPAITHVSCLNGTNGSIKLNNTTGGTAPYTYTWQPGSLSTNSITSKGLGNYTVTIKGTGATTNTYKYNIGYKIYWQNSYGGMITNSTGDTLIQARTDHASTWLETSDGANILSGSTNGWVEYVVTNTGYSKIFGLVDSVGTGWNNIDFAMILNSGGTVSSINNGSQVSLGTYTIGDVLRIERSGSSIIYSKNNTAMTTMTISAGMTQARLTVRGALYNYGARFENMGCSFPATNINASSSTIISCSALTSTLTGTTTIIGGTYTWSPTGSSANSLTTTVTSGGTYSLSITTPTFGCVLTTTVAVLSTAANVNAGANKIITCTSPTAVLTGSSTTSGATYSWSPGGITTSSLSTTTAGTYTLKVTNPANGCTATATVAVTSNTTLPNITVSTNPTLTCTTPTAVLTGSSSTTGATYSWSPGGITTSTLNVTTAGSYILKVTDPSNGCTATSTVAVTSNTTLPNISIVNSPTLTCSAPTAILTGSSSTSGVTYSWSPGGTTISTLSVTTAGSYTLKVTNPANGCIATATVAITSNTTLPNVSIVNSPTLTCSAPTAVLTGSSTTSGATYSWSPTGATTSTLNVTTAGTYTLKVTNPANGCTATATVAVTSNTTLPTIGVSNPTLTCATPTAVLTGSSSVTGATYSWSLGGVITSTLNVTTAGTYTLKVTDPSNGCIATATVAITSNTTLPNVSITNSPTITVLNPAVAITATSTTSGVTYSWTPGGSMPTNSTTTVSVVGIYTIVVTNPINGCMASSTVTVKEALAAQIIKEHATTDNLYAGILALNARGGTPPYTYYCQETGSTQSVQTNLYPGTYHMTITDSVSNTIQLITSIGLKNNWHIQKNISVNTNTYVKTNTDSRSTGALVSYNMLPSSVNGFCEITVSDSTQQTAFGFLGFTGNDIDPNYTSPYATDIAIANELIYVDSLLLYNKINVGADYRTAPRYSNIHLVYFDKGKVKIGFKNYSTSTPDTITYKEGDLFRMQRTGSSILLYKNNTLVASETSNTTDQYLVNSMVTTRAITMINALGTLSESTQFLSQAIIPAYVCSNEPNLNWVRTRTFDENGMIKSDSKTFMDMIGRAIQSQTKLFSQQNVLVTEPLYDSYGRGVGQTLPAPSFNTDICYVPHFIESTPNVSYAPQDFDKSIGQGTGSDIIDAFNAWGDVNNPRPVSNTTQGKLGWYYSNNNTVENLVAADNLPYARTELYPDGRPRRSASVGTNLSMGTGHETKFIYTSTPAVYDYNGVVNDPSSNELNYVFPHRTYELEKDFSVVTSPASAVNLNLQLFKTISINPDGKDQITYTNSSGQTIATCITGDGSGCVTHQDIKQLLPVINQENRQNIYIPKTTAGSFRFTEFANIGNVPIPTAAIPVLKDIIKGVPLVSGTDYTYNVSSGYFTFIGNYFNKSLYLQVTYTLPSGPIPSGNRLVTFVNSDYTQWTLYFYDRKGRLLANASPNDVQCQPNPYLVQKTSTTGSAPQPCSTDPIAAIDFNSTAKSIKNSTLYFKITPTAGSISNFTSATPHSHFVFQTFAQKNSQDSLYALANPIPDSIRVITLADTVGIVNRGLLDSSSVSFYRKLDSLATKVPINALRGKKITYTGNYAFYQKVGTTEVRLETPVIPYAYSIQIDNNQTSTSSVACKITPIISNVYPVQLNLTATPSSIVLRAENTTMTYDGFGQGTNSANPCDGSGYVPSHMIPILGAINEAVALGIDLSVFTDDLGTPINIPLANKYMYNEYDLLVGSINQDQGAVNYVYDQLEDKLLFTQNDKQLANGGRFSCIVYDNIGRPIMTGEYKATTGSTTPYQFQNYYDYKNGVAVASGFMSTGTAAYANSSAYNDGRITDPTMMVYDNADAQLPINTANSTLNQKYTAAKVSKTYNTQSTTWYSYDELGRQTWSVHNSAELGYKTMEYTYDMRGKLLQSNYQKGKADNMIHNYTYDADERLTSASYGIFTMGSPSNFMQPLANYSYYLHGPLKRTLLGGNLQGLDYTYTIDGKLKSVNNPISTLTNLDPGLDGYSTGPNASVSPDAFSFSLEYYPKDYARANSPIKSYFYTSAFNDDNTSYAGLIKATSWRTKLPAAAPANYTDALMYEYKYDELYRLTNAQFGSITENPPPVFANDQPTHSFVQLPEYKLQNLSYDKNGNIQTLKRYAAPITATTAHVLDDLTYNYSATQKNSLAQITDVASNTAGYTADLDLPNQPTGANYVYNQIGELVVNTQEDKGFEYNASGLTTRVYYISTGLNIATYTYNDKGLRHCKTSYNSVGTALKATYYSYDAGGAQVASYTKDLINRSIIQIQDFTLYGAGRVAMYDAATGTAMFELTDHLGNTRAVISRNATTGLAQTVTYTDYFPHGSVLPGRNYTSSLNFPYAYQGQEKDPETGLTSFELRQYDGRIGRWYNPDPMGQHHSPYLAMSNNPISSIDPDGGTDYEIDGMPVSESTYNTYTGNSGADFGINYGGLSYGTNIGYSYNGENYYGKHGYAGALEAQQNHWGSQGITTDGSGNYYQTFNFALISNYDTRAGGVSVIDVTDMANAVLDNNRAEMMYDYYQGSAKSAFNRGDYSEWFAYKTKMLLGENADEKFSKAAEPYAQMIADLNPLMNASHIINGIATGQNAYGETMGKGGYAMAAVGLFPGGAELKELGAATEGGRGLWTLSKEGASAIKNHKTFGTIYKSSSDGLWWAMDKAGHGGSKYKVFKETNGGLEWFKDADGFGDFIINKHKGPTGTFIPWGQLGTVK